MRILNELPRTLDETYERILLGIDEEKQEYAIRLFRCLAFSRRPLRIKELAEVFAVELDVGAIPRLNVNLRPEDADEAVLSACSTLVSINKPGGSTIYDDDFRVVQFSHYSVKEFLTSKRLAKSERGDLSQYHISPEAAHTVLAQTCISSLLQLDNSIRDIAHCFPLAEYAARTWFHHARCDGVASQIQEGMERLLDPDRTHFGTWISIHDIDNPWSLGGSRRTEGSPLYYATLCGIISLVEHLIITRQHDPNQIYGRQGTPLRVAVVSEHTEIARVLLEHAADANARDMNHVTPLHEAAKRGNADIVQLLINHGADVTVLDYRRNSPLHKALRLRNFRVVELLVKSGADVNVRIIYNLAPLHIALDREYLDIAQFLISHGADVNASAHREFPLYQALKSRKYDVVELLIKGGADVNIRNIHNSTPLHAALDLGYFDIAQFLIMHGANVNALDRRGDSPLRKALRTQKRDVMELLLKSGANVNVRNIHNSTLLHDAVESGNLDFVQLLFNYGADVNALDNFGDSPLHKALPSQDINFPAVKLWQNPYTMLSLRVSKQGNYAMAQSLLGHGADVNARGRKRKTPLHLASSGGSLDLSRLLIEHGADADAQDDEGQTPFSTALANGHRKVARFLSNDHIPEHGV